MSVWEEIVDYTVPSTTASVTFNNFGTITKDDFIKIKTNVVNNTSVARSFGLNFNNTNASDYYIQVLWSNGNSVTAVRANTIQIGEHNAFSSASSTTFVKLSENNTANVFTNTHREDGSGLWNNFFYNTSINTDFSQGITSMTFYASNNSFGANSRIQIYKLTAEKVADITVASNTTQVDITGLNIDKGSEYLLVSDDKANVSHLLYIYPNNLTTSSNYYSQGIRTIDTSVFASRENTPRIHYHDGGQQSLILSNIKISNTSSFITQNEGLRNYGNGSTFRISKNNTSSTYENLSNVTSLKITSSATNGIGANSRFELYKLY